MRSATPERACYTLFAGPNGAGKSTAYDRFCAAGYESGEYLNPDDVARSLGGGAAIELRAGRIVVERVRRLISTGQSVVRETTLSGREIQRSVDMARRAGFRLVVVFVAMSDLRTMHWRVGIRVATGGHDIPQHVLQRRFHRSLVNVAQLARVADMAYFLDNAGSLHRLVATANRGVITFLEAHDADWVKFATSGLPAASILKSREGALAELREREGLAADLQVREHSSAYLAAGLDSTR